MRYFYRGSTLLIRFKTKEMTDRQTITGYSIGATIMGYEGVVDPVDEYSFNITFDEAITAVLPEGPTPIVLSLTKDDITALGQVKGLAAVEPSINETCGITDVVTCEVTIEDITLNYGMVFNNVVTYQDLTDAQKIEMLSGIQADADALFYQLELTISEGNDAVDVLEGKATLADEATLAANNAANLANEKAGLANDAATLANQKAGLANDAAILANQKALYADEKGDYAKEQGDYAKEQGDYAKNIGDTYDAAKINKDGSNSAIQTLTFMGVTDADEPVELTMQYNKDDGTYNFTLPSGATGQLFQELYFHAKATEAITEGDAIQYAGAQGRHALVKKAVPSEIRANPYLFIGVATTSAANNAFCKVTWFGNISGVSTTGWSLGNILYFDSANGVSGKLTNVMPTAPNTRINVGVVTLLSTGGASNGTILVRPEFHNKLVDSDDVYAPTLTNGVVLKWNSTNSRFEVFNVDTALGLKTDKTALETTEEVTAQALVELKERVDAIDEFIKQGLLNNIIINTLSVESLQLNGAPLIITNTVAPAIVPDFVGQFYIKTSATTACYQATGNTVVGDWKQIG